MECYFHRLKEALEHNWMKSEHKLEANLTLPEEAGDSVDCVLPMREENFLLLACKQGLMLMLDMNEYCVAL